jgi:hypothetical protein
MTMIATPGRAVHSAARGRLRGGTGSLDTLVAFTLLVTVLSVATPLVVRHTRLLKSQRDYRLALDELSNQMDRLTALSADELPNALNELTPSSFLAERIPGSRLSGELQAAETGFRLKLRLSWDESQQNPPVSLAAWVIRPRSNGSPPGGSP